MFMAVLKVVSEVIISSSFSVKYSCKRARFTGCSLLIVVVSR